jgi:hypothetical protein
MSASQRTYHLLSTGLLKRLLLALVFLVFGQLSAQVKAKVDSTTIRIGEEILYQLEVEADSTELVLFPEGQTFCHLR